MEIKRIFKSCGMLLFGAAILTGCSEDETFDIDGSVTNMVYLRPTLNADSRCQVLRTPAGVFGRVAADLTVSMQYNATDSVRLSAAVLADNAVVDKYNEANGTDYAMPSADVLAAMTITPSGIGVGKSVTEKPVTISLPADKLAALTEPTCIIPVQLVLEGVDGSTGTRPVTASTEMDKSFIIVNTSDADNFTSVTGATEISCNVVHTPVGTFGGISATVPFANLCAVSGDMQGTLVVDNSLIADYNASHGTAYVQLPAAVQSQLTITPGIVKEGDTQTTEGIRISVPESVTETLEGSYLIPMRLQTSFANGVVYDEDDIVYIKVDTKTSLMNDKPTAILGTIQSNGDDVWSCVSAENFDPEGMRTQGWRPTATRVSSAEVVIDLGAEHKVSSFMVDFYVMTNAHIYLSTDNSQWTDVGETQGNGTVRDDNWQSWYVLYGGVPARYVKMVFTLNQNHWAWNYPQWGYCDLSFGFAFDD